MQTFPAGAPAPLSRALRDDGSLDPDLGVTLSDELAVALYEQMVLARELDQRVVRLQREGQVTQHASAIGEEGAIVGAAAAMQDDDWLFLATREVAAALWRGMPLVAYAHHVLGSARAAGKGRSAQSAPFWKPANVVSVSPLSGTQIAHAVGVAWAARIRKKDIATLVFFGDGATSSADFHTALNFAGVTRAPVVALCRNNGWATSLPASKQTASEGFAIKATAYGLHGVRVDGADVVAVLGAVREARARALAGGGGTLVEAVTASSLDGAVDDRREAVDSGERDPIVRMRRHLDSRGLSSAERERRLLVEVGVDVDRAFAEAESELEALGPGGERPARDALRASLFDDVYAEVPWHLRDQRDGAPGSTRTAARTGSDGE